MKKLNYLLLIAIVTLLTGCMPKVQSVTKGYINYTNCITPVIFNPKSNLSHNHQNLYSLTSQIFYEYGIDYVAPPNCEYVYFTDYSVFKGETKEAVFSNHMINYAWKKQRFSGKTGQIVYKLVIGRYNAYTDNYDVIWEGIMQSTTDANLDNPYEEVYQINEQDRFMVEKMVEKFFSDTGIVRQKSNFTLNPKKIIYNSKEGLKSGIQTGVKMIDRNKFGVIPATPDTSLK